MIAKRLNKGDKIGVVAPSTPVTEDRLQQFSSGLKFLEDLGFEVVVGSHVYANTWGYAASPQEKADDINQMFADGSVDAIICAQGGVTANACLHHLDWQIIEQNPKVFLGISDITVLLNALYARVGLVTFHGNDVMWGFGRTPTQYDRQEFVARLMEAQIGAVNRIGGRETVRSGVAEGTLLGGNLPCLLKLAGTPYLPDFTASVLFVEALDIAPQECDHMFHQLKHMGVFDGVQGVVIGYIDGLQNDESAVAQMEDVLLNITAEYDFPVLKVNDFGHNCPNTVLPVGGRVKIDADEQEIVILDPCVE